MSMPTLYFFGAWDQPGHYLHTANGRRACFRTEAILPWSRIDGVLCPGGAKPYETSRQTEGHAKLHYKNNWTALAWWDRSIDKRFNSNAVLFTPGRQDVMYLLEHALVQFATRWEHIDYPIVVVDQVDDLLEQEA